MNNNLMRRAVACVMAAVVSLAGISPALAQTSPAVSGSCQSGGVLFGFFNGVLTTPFGADDSLAKFRTRYAATSVRGDQIRYETFYNKTEGFDDFVETFDQRLKEQDGILAGRFELFFEALNGGGSWWSAITEAVPAFVNTLSAFIDWGNAAIPRMLTQMMGSPATEQTLAEQRVRIDNGALEGRKMLFVAHSQGNLFANSAYDYAVTKVPAGAVYVVHIASPAPILHGPEVLADQDIVINMLRVVGSVPPITDYIPLALARTPGLNGKTDVFGHGLQEIYLNPAFTTAAHIDGYILDGFNTLVAPPVLAASGFFTATLTWDGPGDVDLHTLEPSGAHVYFGAKVGSSGFLDVDNVRGYGPEHYYATCDSSKLRTGTYAISLANYSGAQGRNATVQIASNTDGVLATKTVTMGASTGVTPSVPVFSVNVTSDPATGKLRASIGN